MPSKKKPRSQKKTAPVNHRGVADGFAQWYKEKLLEEALPTETATETPADEKEAA